MATPKPGQRVRGSETGRPVMALLDLIGRRWCLRVMWELRDGPLNFRALQARAGGISPSVLNTRLKELKEVGLVSPSSDDGYALTPQGEQLQAMLLPLHAWAERWAKRQS
jgi:DNA-binding HxlR family transcriptional regulator